MGDPAARLCFTDDHLTSSHDRSAERTAPALAPQNPAPGPSRFDVSDILTARLTISGHASRTGRACLAMSVNCDRPEVAGRPSTDAMDPKPTKLVKPDQINAAKCKAGVSRPCEIEKASKLVILIGAKPVRRSGFGFCANDAADFDRAACAPAPARHAESILLQFEVLVGRAVLTRAKRYGHVGSSSVACRLKTE
jgi:hypothetical protein